MHLHDWPETAARDARLSDGADLRRRVLFRSEVLDEIVDHDLLLPKAWRTSLSQSVPLVIWPSRTIFVAQPATSTKPFLEAAMDVGRRYKTGGAQSAAQEFDRAADQLDRLAKRSRSMSQEERERHGQPVARMLRETAEIARYVRGTLPRAWTYYLSARRAFGSDAALAGALGVNRSRIARWKQGERPDPTNEAKLRDLDIVVSLLSDYLEEEAIPDWLNGFNPHLSNRRPIDVLRSGRLSELVRAIEAEKSGAFS